MSWVNNQTVLHRQFKWNNQSENESTKIHFQVDKVAEYFAISVRTVYRLIEKWELKRAKIRNHLRIAVWELIDMRRIWTER